MNKYGIIFSEEKVNGITTHVSWISDNRIEEEIINIIKESRQGYSLSEIMLRMDRIINI